ncbi:thermonuclease family protein, partial [Escherichia coli]
MFFITKLLLPIMIVVFPVASWGNSTTFEAKVVKIVDGDTITALDAQNTTIKIRMYGIDAPESKQAFGQKAKQALTTAIATKIVTVIDHGTDIYGRMLGTIWLDGYDINASMVDSGYAWVYRFEDNAIVPGYIKYESAAQKEAKGLWADTNPVPPWQWRQANEKPRKVKE